MPPRVTVLTAVHDGLPYLREAVESVLGQTFADFELLVVDDGSTDGSREVVASYRDPRIRLVVNERNVGLARSLNRGLELARGSYVARLDADDVSEPRRLERQVAFLDSHPEVALVGAWHRAINAVGRPFKAYHLPCDVTDLRWALLFYSPFVHSAAMWRRCVVRELVGAYDERLAYSMDYDLWLRIARRMPIASLPEHLVRLRVHRGSMTAAGDERTREGVRMRAEAVAGLLGWPEEISQREERFHRMYTLLQGDPRALATAEMRHAMDDVRALQAVFAREQRLGAREARVHRARVYRRVGRRLLHFARSLLRQGSLVRSGEMAREGLRCYRLALVGREVAP